MRKDYKSIACPECKSIDVDIKTTYKNKHSKEIIYIEDNITEYYQERVMECHCPRCNNNYSVNQGKDSYKVFKKPLSITAHNIQLLAIFDSSFEKNFKIIKTSTYNGASITMALVENEEYPVILSEKQDITDLPKIKKILFDKWMNNHY